MLRSTWITRFLLLSGLLVTRSSFASPPPPLFASPPLVVPAGVVPHAIAVGDFDENGRPDLAVANRGGTIGVLLQTIEHTFATTQVPTTSQPYSVATGDLNGDGHLDLVASNMGAPHVAVHLGSGIGTFAPAVTYASNATTISVVIQDMNGDGTADVVTGNYGSASVSFYPGLGDGTLGTRRDISTQGDRVWAVSVGDLDRDGRPDILSANEGTSTVSFIRGLGLGQFAPAVITAVGPSPRGIAVADVDLDGDLDVVAQNGDGTTTVLRGAGDGSLSAAPPLGQGSFAFGVAVGDVNGDGILDLASVQGGLQSVSFLLGRDGSQFEFWSGVSSGDSPRAVAIADLDGASGPEVIIANAGANTVTILFSRTVFFPQPSTTSLSLGPSPTFYGQELELRARVRPDTSIGTVEFRAGASMIGAAPLLSGVATLRLPSLLAGSHSLSAVFTGNSFVSASTSASVSHAVLRTPVSVSLVSEPNPSEQHQPAVFSVTVMPIPQTFSIPSGVVRLSVDGVEVGPEQGSPLEDGRVSVSLATLSPGDRTIAASYEPPDAQSFAPGSSEAYVHTVLPLLDAPTGRPTALTLSGALPNPSNGRQLVIALGLPSADGARLEVLDVTGRRRWVESLDSFGPGTHSVRVTPARPLPAGIYLLRLVQGRHERRGRFVVVD